MTDYQVENQFDERVIDIARVAKVVKGGRRFSFRVTMVIGDNNGRVGLGIGKANAVPDAIRKASERARKDMHKVNLNGTTIPMKFLGNKAAPRFCSVRPLPVPALSLVVAFVPCWKQLASTIFSPSHWAVTTF